MTAVVAVVATNGYHSRYLPLSAPLSMGRCLYSSLAERCASSRLKGLQEVGIEIITASNAARQRTLADLRVSGPLQATCCAHDPDEV